MTSKQAGKKSGFPNWAKTVSAILISVLILAFYFKDIDWIKFLEVISGANWWMAFLAIIVPQIFFWVFNVYQTERTFAWFHRPLDWKNLLWVRGAMNLAMMVNTGLGSAGNILYLQQQTQVSWARFIAIAFFRTSVQLSAITIFLIILTIGMHWTGVFDKTPLNPWIWWTILILGQLTFWDGWFYFLKGKAIGLSRYFFVEHDTKGRLLSRFRDPNNELWETFRIAKKSHWILLMLWANIPVVVMIISYWYFAKAFNIEIPFILFTVTILLVGMIQDTPLAFAGFGSTTLAWSLFYADYASPESIAGLSLCLPLIKLIVRFVIGIISLRPAITNVTMIIEEYRKGNRTFITPATVTPSMTQSESEKN